MKRPKAETMPIEVTLREATDLLQHYSKHRTGDLRQGAKFTALRAHLRTEVAIADGADLPHDTVKCMLTFTCALDLLTHYWDEVARHTKELYLPLDATGQQSLDWARLMQYYTPKIVKLQRRLDEYTKNAEKIHPHTRPRNSHNVSGCSKSPPDSQGPRDGHTSHEGANSQ